MLIILSLIWMKSKAIILKVGSIDFILIKGYVWDK